MHELSLVRSLLSQVAAIARQHEAEGVDEIRVEIGPLSGVEPLLVQSAFAQIAEGPEWAGARLVIDEVSLGAVCVQCSREFEVERFRFECPDCGSRQVRVVRGDGFVLVSVTVRQPEAPVGQAVPDRTFLGETSSPIGRTAGRCNDEMNVAYGSVRHSLTYEAAPPAERRRNVP